NLPGGKQVAGGGSCHAKEEEEGIPAWGGITEANEGIEDEAKEGRKGAESDVGMASASTCDDLVVKGSSAVSDHDNSARVEDLKEAKQGEKEVAGGIVDVKEKGETEEGTKAEGDVKKNMVSDQGISSGASNIEVSSNEQDLPASSSTKKDREDETEEEKKGESDVKSSSFGDLGHESTN
ncbi:hypothetical protein Tsubulata_022339, partial [Turnera subulata]